MTGPRRGRAPPAPATATRWRSGRRRPGTAARRRRPRTPPARAAPTPGGDGGPQPPRRDHLDPRLGYVLHDADIADRRPGARPGKEGARTPSDEGGAGV